MAKASGSRLVDEGTIAALLGVTRQAAHGLIVQNELKPAKCVGSERYMRRWYYLKDVPMLLGVRRVKR